MKNATVPNAAKLGGRPASAYARASTDASGFVVIPSDGKMHRLRVDNYEQGGPTNSSLPYSVLGADHATYAGFFEITMDLYGAPCGASVSAIG